MKVAIETIPHESQRYPTCGDWFYDQDGTLHIRISQLSDRRRELLLVVHELIEALLCGQSGVTQEQVDQFDFEFESKIANRTVLGGDEPGDEPEAPYRREHCLATAVERMLAAYLNVDWRAYDRELYSLEYPEHWRRKP